MNTIITARHDEVPDEVKARAKTLVERLSKLAHRPVSAEVVFDNDHQNKIVELIFHLPRSKTRVASAEGPDYLTALDRAELKLKHQLGKDDPATRNGRRKKTA